MSDKIWYSETDIQEIELEMNYRDLELNTPYHITLPANDITEEGISYINQWFFETIYNYDGRRRAKFPGWWRWKWLITKSAHKYVGTMPKRISKWAYKNYNIRLTPTELAEVGTLTKTHTIEDADYVFDITSTPPTWIKGDFGDPDSCYFGINIDAQDVLQSLNATALRIFQPNPITKVIDRHIAQTMWLCHKQEKVVTLATTQFGCSCEGCRETLKSNWQLEKLHGQYIWWGGVPIYKTTPALTGWGRCWVVPHETNLVIFNAYGKYQLFALARILATLLGLSYRPIGVKGNDESLWINISHMRSGGSYGNGYIIGEYEAITNAANIEFDCSAAIYEDTFL